MKSVLTSQVAVLLLLGGGAVGCNEPWQLESIRVEPLALTAGSDESWTLQAVVAPGTSGDPYRLLVRCELPSGGDCPCWHDVAQPWGCSGYANVGAEDLWSFLWDTGTLGDEVRGDFVFTHTGAHPFESDYPPGRYRLTIGPADPDGGSAVGLSVEIEVLPPP